MSGARNILIVGPPRSGTSLTAAALARNGYFVGGIARRNQREGNDDNPFGFFEADRLIDQNVELLHAAGFPHHNTWKFAEISRASVERLEQLPARVQDQQLVREYDEHSPWLWKDPRLCYTLAYWWRWMDPRTTGVVLVRRSIEQVYSSFKRMGWCGTNRAAVEACRRRIKQHIEAAEQTVQRLNIPHVTLDYQCYLKDPQESAGRLSAFCGANISPESLNVRTELNHASASGRLGALLRRSLDHGPLRYARILKPLVPRAVVLALLPEKNFTGKGEPC